MPVSRLSLTDFRSYADLVIAPGAGFVTLIGENGAGKTNVLEAVSLMAPGRGLRGAGLREMARMSGQGGFSIAARLDDDVEIGTGIIPGSGDKRIVRINGANANAAELGERLSLVWLTPAQDRLFTASAGERRRFLDRLVLALDPAHSRDLTRYEAAMRQRNKLLAEERSDAAWLTAIESAMGEHGSAIADRRAWLVATLGERIASAGAGPFARATLRLEGDVPTPSAFARMLADGRARDAAAGRALVGPQRQDLIVAHLEKNVDAASSSTGEQKALLIGIVLAHASLVAERAGRPPVLLLDEIAAHLDPVRRAALFARLAADGAQVWMTGTEPALFDSIEGDATRFRVAEGRVEPV